MDVPIARAEDGRFAPGSSGNPGGRRGLPADIRAQLEAALPKAVARLVQLVESTDERVAQSAIDALLSRLYGRPSVAVDATVTGVTPSWELHLEARKELAARKRERQQTPVLMKSEL